ncbi:MAG TPA: hypothetical protein VGD40_18585 [Chryseosolibacter sp.]
MDYKRLLTPGLLVVALQLLTSYAYGQHGTSTEKPNQKVIVITGARACYSVIERWIDEYSKTNSSVQIVVEARGSNDPQKYDILAELYEHPAEIRETRAYVNVGRYAVFPVANATSAFAKIYAEEGLTRQHINQIFFHDIFADKEKEKTIKAPYTVYTRLQKAGVPQVFSRYFGYEQKDIKGTGIAGADSHLIKALLRDSTGITYLPTASIFQINGRVHEGLVVIPADLNGNNRISDDEKSIDRFDKVIDKIENASAADIKNVPVDYFHLSIDKKSAKADAVDFLKWVNENGHKYLHEYGFLLPEPKRADKEKFNEFVSQKGR